MEARELRHGNLILQLDDNLTCRVEALPNDNFIQYSYPTNPSHHKSVFGEPTEFFTGIPIAEEWLLKFGWSHLNGQTSGDLTKDFGGKIDYDFIDGKMMLKSHYEDKYRYREVSGLKHVHQLQNLYFALTGKELEIK